MQGIPILGRVIVRKIQIIPQQLPAMARPGAIRLAIYIIMSRVIVWVIVVIKRISKIRTLNLPTITQTITRHFII